MKAKLELIDELDRMYPPYIMSGYGAVLDKEPGEPAVVEHGVPGQHGEILDIVRTHSVEPGKGKVETADTIKSDDAPVVSRKSIDIYPGVTARKPMDRMPADFPPPRTRK